MCPWQIFGFRNEWQVSTVTTFRVVWQIISKALWFLSCTFPSFVIHSSILRSFSPFLPSLNPPYYTPFLACSFHWLPLSSSQLPSAIQLFLLRVMLDILYYQLVTLLPRIMTEQNHKTLASRGTVELTLGVANGARETNLGGT